MKIQVDPWLCQGHQLCTEIAPELFAFDPELSHTVAVGDVSQAGALSARRAADLCPERAIVLNVEDANGA
jgi:ferredoxin